MKNRTISIGLLLSLVLVSVASCAPPSGTKETTSQPVQVMRGDLTLTVSGSGAIEMSHERKLTFSTAGRIETLLVEEGGEVAEGTILAVLESDSLALALAQAKVASAQAQVAAEQSAVAVIQAEAAVTQAEIGLKSAEIALEQTIKTTTLSDIRIAQAAVDTAKSNLADSILILGGYTPGTTGYLEFQKNVVLAQARLDAAQNALDAMLSGFSPDELIVKQQQVTVAEQSLTAARQSLELAKLSMEVAQQSLALAKQSVDHAQKQLDKATLTAPFAGIIADLPVKERDTVLATTTIVHLMEPNKMELKVQVDEIDIPAVKLGQRAIIKVDALPGKNLSGKVSYINLIPRKEAGVTLFEVKIALDIGYIGLMSGMSASADIVTAERNDILLVPSRVVSQNSQGDTVVLLVVNGQNEEKVVTTGISDGFLTEVTAGLKEGDTVIEKR